MLHVFFVGVETGGTHGDCFRFTELHEINRMWLSLKGGTKNQRVRERGIGK